MKKSVLMWIVTLINVISFSQFENIQLPKPKKATYHYSQVEPSIFINPNNTNEVIAGSVMNDYYYSKDGGVTWKSKSIKSKTSGVNGDPCMLIDNEGNYYYFHLSNIDGQSLVGGMVCERSSTIKGCFRKEGHTLIDGKFHDKEWVALNPKNNHIYMTWTRFDAYDSKDTTQRSNIVFSKSIDNGMTWSTPIDISKFSGDCQDNDLTAEGATPSVGVNGEIFVVWARDSRLYLNYSLDEGLTWLEEEVRVSTQEMGWVLDIPGIYRCNGLPVTAYDNSTSPYSGTLYANWGDQRNGVDDTDIWLKKSTDGGLTWSKDIRVNGDDSKHHQFLSWLTVDQVTGYVYVMYYDRRNSESIETDVYLSVSKDGGDTFNDYKISESPFVPSQDVFFGDYTNISVHNGVIRPIWTRLDDKQISLYTAIINQEQLNKIDF